jgi:hypothetical protein
LIRHDEANKLLLRRGLERVIEPPLIAQRRNRVGRKLLAAKRTGAVCRIDKNFVRQREQFVVERIIKICAEVGGRPPKRRVQVRPTSPMKSVSPVSTAYGVAESFRESNTRIEIDSMVWPGVSSTCSPRPGKSRRSPSFIA